MASGARVGSRAGFDRRLAATMVLGSVLNPVNSAMIAVALVPIGVAFHAPPARTAWLISALYLATAVGQPVVGRLVDRYGPRPLYLAGTALVGAAGLLGALAPSLGVLVAARVLLGFGTCAGYPASMYLVSMQARRTGRDAPGGILTVLAVANQVTAVVGPTLGGLLIGLGGWRAIFLVNVPLAAACLVLGTRRLPRIPTAGGPARLDPAGMVLFAATLLALMLFLMAPARWYLLPAAAAAAAALAVRELRTAHPFIDLRVLRGNGPLLATYLRQVLTFTASYAFIYGYTQWLEDDRGLHPSVTGLVLLPSFVTAIVAAALSGRRRNLHTTLAVGAAAAVVAAAAPLLARPHSGVWLLVAVGVLAGVPQGVNGLANQNALYRQADTDRIASAAGLLRTFMYLGALAASAAVAACYPRGARTAGLHTLSLVMLACAVVLVAVTLPDRSLARTVPPVGAVRSRA